MAVRRKKVKGASGRVLHLDLFSGIAGNMFLAALLDAGLSRRELVADLAGLKLEHSLRVKNVKRGALSARYLEVRVPKRRGAKKASADHRDRGRTYLEITQVLERAKLDAVVRERALAIFEALGRAEAKVHGVPLEQVPRGAARAGALPRGRRGRCDCRCHGCGDWSGAPRDRSGHGFAGRAGRGKRRDRTRAPAAARARGLRVAARYSDRARTRSLGDRDADGGCDLAHDRRRVLLAAGDDRRIHWSRRGQRLQGTDAECSARWSACSRPARSTSRSSTSR
ncbi:MAG: DUF111 family protein [Deltaproteobacteria bacterium]|nr:DUF111 family protein [Deltaproteobacteria bacterium]